METFDVVIIGAGIAGSALAAVLAPAGVSVLLLERQIDYRDKVRGEFMAPWGVAELQRLGLEDVLLGAGGSYSTKFVAYDEDVDPGASESAPLAMGDVIDGVPGALNVGHPQASRALRSLAEDRGSTVCTGIGDVAVSPGTSPAVSYELDGELHDVRSRLVIGADGRQSSVRRSLGIELRQVTSKAALGGLLVRTEAWPEDRSVTANEGDVVHLAFPRADGHVRLYLACEPGQRTAGTDRARLLFDAFQNSAFPFSAALSRAEVAGPCSYVMGSDGWTDQPVVEGVVLIGDAAGWSDPIIGQGLSVALRDTRMVSDVLLRGDDWSPRSFREYGAERAERMRRLRFSGNLTTEIRCTFTPQGRARRAAFRSDSRESPLTRAPLQGNLTGPETQVAEAFEPENLERILSLS